MRGQSVGCAGRGLGSLQRVPEPAGSGETGFPERSTALQFSRLPERTFGCAPGGVGERQRRKSLAQAHQSLHISKTELLDEHAQRPAIGNGMMNCEDQNMVIGASAQYLHPVERSLDRIERLPENLLRQLFDGLFATPRRRKLSE